ncbi:MAG: ATP-dependent DNA helicase RecG [Leptothrix ochracea]|uniref:ATP-dependent DNA helicase RecG n=1 Tax=Leptothrix ochracea TaxID=735331 RepID=UPI0034E283C2
MPEQLLSPSPLSAPQRALQKLGLVRDMDLALHMPLRYEDETRLSLIAQVRDGETAQIEAQVREARIETRTRRQLLVTVHDGSATLLLRFVHFYPSHQKTLAVGARVRVRGEVRMGFAGREMIHPTFKAVQGDVPLAAALTPVYPTVAQLPQAYLRRAIDNALQRADLSELMPTELVPAGLPALRSAVHFLHKPPPDAPLAALEQRMHPAWQRLKFEELLAQQISQQLAHEARAQLKAPALRAVPEGLPTQLLAVLPFTLTAAQQRVVEEIAGDLAATAPMHRLLQGDVGSGKTVVAALAAAVTLDAGWQCVLMAPTEILAEQHWRKLVEWLAPLRLRDAPIQVAWLTGSRKGKARAQERARVASGEAQLIVGTHAVIQDEVQFARLGLAIVDEQHRFGVQQRLALRRKLTDAGRGLEPHLLMMTATPIPRTLAMSYFADLDVSTIDTLPPGRSPIVTRLLPESRRDALIERVQAAVAQGRQVYWVCPLIEEGEATEDDKPKTDLLGRPPLDLANVTATHQELSEALPGVGVGLLHGRLPAAQKADVMARFSAAELAVLVATTVIEVGVDVPNASVMVIEHADRFGLAQLHQLRGRVGRGATASVCMLLHGAAVSATGRDRLRAMVETQDGFEIARRDLEIRGPGELMGERQSGDNLLRFADLQQDEPLLVKARQAATTLLKRQPVKARAHMLRWLGERMELLKA